MTLQSEPPYLLDPHAKCLTCTRFIDSEADLDSAIKALIPLAQVPVLAYSELVKSGAVAQLIGLLSHENLDIVIDVVEVIHELTDEDVGNEAGEDEDGEKNTEALKILIEGLVSPMHRVIMSWSSDELIA
jgi:beta-catenin-like protein 1